MTPDERKRRAQIAENTLHHDFIKSCFNDLRQGTLIELERTQHEETEKREDLYYLLRAVKALEGLLATYIRDGQMAENQIANTHIKRLIK